jgi:hypothetical protein
VSAVELGAVANRLFEGFLAPLVLGGEVSPSRPVGARAALAMGRERVVADSDLLARVQLARMRVARRLVPVDRLPEPTEPEWALGAALHDLVQAAHPAFDAAFRRGGPPRILDLVDATTERVPAPRNVGESLSRHTWFSRLLELKRTDTVVRWWVGSRTFLGETPPARLSAWPELRRVNVEKTARTIMDLPGAGGFVDAARFGATLSGLLARTPLTDLATCFRPVPVFAWGSESLGLVGTGPGRSLAARALALAPRQDTDAALGRATRALIDGGAFGAAAIAIDLLAERALSHAELADPEKGRDGRRSEARELATAGTDDATYARSVGALVACAELRSPTSPFSERDRVELLARLAPLASSPVARAVHVALTAPNPRRAAETPGPPGPGAPRRRATSSY